MIAEQPIEQASRVVAEMEEAIRAENDRRDAFRRMLGATDRVLWRLEELNRDGITRVPGDLRIRFPSVLAVLPSSCLSVFRDDGSVQEVLDSVFAVQEELLRRHDPSRLVDDHTGDEPATDAAMDAELMARIRESLALRSLKWSDLLGCFALREQDDVARLVAVLEERGEVRSFTRRTRRGRPARM